MTLYINALTGFQVAPQPWQKKLKAGDYYEIEPLDGSAFPVIYGLILKEICSGYLWVKAYSIWCVDGEEGSLCIVEPTRRITKEEFDMAQNNNWQKAEGD